MIDSNLILSECYVDTLFMNMVLKNMHEEGWANHHQGISVVANAMLMKFKNKTVIGLVDDDRVKPDYFKEFDQIDQASGLLLKKHLDKDHYLIVISPVFEHWAFKAARALEIKGNPVGANPSVRPSPNQ